MDKTVIQSLRNLFYEKIRLYNDLLECLAQEREALINIDLDKLWNISKEKEEICSKTKTIKKELLSTLYGTTGENSVNLEGILKCIPKDERIKFQKPYLFLMKLKREVEARREENISFIDDSLQFLDELIAIIAGENRSKVVYNNKSHLCQSGTNIFLNRKA